MQVYNIKSHLNQNIVRVDHAHDPPFREVIALSVSEQEEMALHDHSPTD